MSVDPTRRQRGGAQTSPDLADAGRRASMDADAERRSDGEPTNFRPSDTDRAVQVMCTELLSLTQLLNGSYSVTNYRTTLLLGVVSASGVALALVAQATRFGDTFAIFALVLLPVVLFIGIATFLRLAHSLHEAILYTQGMNRIRHLFQEHAPSAAPYYVLSSHDDVTGLFESFAHRRSPWLPIFALTTANGVVAVVNSVVAAVIGAVLVIKLGWPGGPFPLVAAASIFLVVLISSMGLWLRSLMRFRNNLTVRFPTTAAHSSQ